MVCSPTPAKVLAQRIVVGVAEFAVASAPQVTLSTYALGSCVGVAAYDPEAQAGGLLHVILPDSSSSPAKARRQPGMFADTGLPALFAALAGVRADRSRLRLFIAGGASPLAGPDTFKIGERNLAAVIRLLDAGGCHLFSCQVGGTINRTLHLNIGTGQLAIKLPDRTMEFALG